MKPPFTILLSLLSVFALLLGGCAMTPARAPLAGFYASTPVFEDAKYFQWADGKSHKVSRERTLTIFPNGDYCTWWRQYVDGELVRFSGLAPYDFQTNSTGSWTLAGERLLFRSTGPSYVVTKWQMQKDGRSIAPEESEASAVYRDGHWVIVWKGTEYLLRAAALPLPTPTNVTPAAGAPVAPPPCAAGR